MTKPLSSLVGLLLLTAQPLFSQSLDPAFTTSRIYKPGTVFSTLEQPDGQRIVAGRFIRANGTAVSNLTRLSAGGVPDAVFQRNLGDDAAGMYRPRLLPNGQLLVIAIGAAPIRAGGLSRASVLRLNADGTGDATFSAGTGATSNGTPIFVDDLLVLPDGKLIVVGPFDQFDGTPANRIVRLTANGAVDPTFQSGTGANSEIETVTIQPDGRLLIGGYFDSYNGNAANGLARLNANGSFDSSFSTPFQTYSEAINLLVQPDGKILAAGGLYTTPAGLGDGRGLVRLLPNGTLDSSFDTFLDDYTSYSYFGDALQLQPDGRILTLTRQNNTVSGVTRLLANGQADFSFQSGQTRYLPYSLTRLANGRLLVGGLPQFSSGGVVSPLAELTEAGTPATGFQPNLQDPGSINSLVRQPDGKVLIGGYFTEVDGQPAAGLARLGAAGGLDASFATPPRASGSVNISSLILQADGRIVGVSDFQVLRYLSNGQPDNSFNTFTLRGVGRLLQQPDGRLLVGDYGGQASASLVRLQADGTADPSFSTATSTLQGIMALALQPDGKILVAGEFRTGAGNPILQTVVRLQANGSQDASFATGNAAGVGSNLIRTLVVQPDGQVLVGGSFTALGTATTPGIVRLTTSGAPATGFAPPALTGTIQRIVLQPNNRILLGGTFTSATVPANLARLLPDGSADASFADTAVPNAGVNALLAQPNGQLTLGGLFSAIGNQPVTALAQLSAPNVLQVPAAQLLAARTHIWPVPAHALLHVAPAPNAQARHVELVNLLGQAVQRVAADQRAAVTLPLASVPAGTYLVRVTYATGTVTTRVLVQ